MCLLIVTPHPLADAEQEARPDPDETVAVARYAELFRQHDEFSLERCRIHGREALHPAPGLIVAEQCEQRQPAGIARMQAFNAEIHDLAGSLQRFHGGRSGGQCHRWRLLDLVDDLEH